MRPGPPRNNARGGKVYVRNRIGVRPQGLPFYFWLLAPRLQRLGISAFLCHRRCYVTRFKRRTSMGPVLAAHGSGRTVLSLLAFASL